VAGVRLDDGSQRFVRGVPEDLAMGAVVRVVLEGVEERGSVSIPPSLVSWCDPSVRCAEFVALERMPEVATVAEVPEPLMVLLAEDGAPDEGALASMLELAHADEDRLDDEAFHQPHGRGRREPDAPPL
jgi:hypothetical protein